MASYSLNGNQRINLYNYSISNEIIKNYRSQVQHSFVALPGI